MGVESCSDDLAFWVVSRGVAVPWVHHPLQTLHALIGFLVGVLVQRPFAAYEHVRAGWVWGVPALAVHGAEAASIHGRLVVILDALKLVGAVRHFLLVSGTPVRLLLCPEP